MKDIEYNKGTYTISRDGTVHNKATGRVLAQSIVNGYARVTLTNGGSQKSFRVHRLVAMAYVPNPDNLPDVDHLDEIKLNNNDWNLKWTGKKENTTRSAKSMATGSAPVPVMIDGKVFPTFHAGASHIADLNPGKKPTTIRREFRRIKSGERAEGLMYGHMVQMV